MPWFPPPHSSTPGIFIVVFILWVFFLLSLKRFNQFPNIKSIPTHLTHIIHEEAFSPAFAHRHREAATKSLWGQSFKIRNLRKAGHTLFLLLFLKNWSRFLNILNVIIVQDSKMELCVMGQKCLFGRQDINFALWFLATLVALHFTPQTCKLV